VLPSEGAPGVIRGVSFWLDFGLSLRHQLTRSNGNCLSLRTSLSPLWTIPVSQGAEASTWIISLYLFV